MFQACAPKLQRPVVDDFRDRPGVDVHDRCAPFSVMIRPKPDLRSNGLRQNATAPHLSRPKCMSNDHCGLGRRLRVSARSAERTDLLSRRRQATTADREGLRRLAADELGLPTAPSEEATMDSEYEAAQQPTHSHRTIRTRCD
jgi:hypothetical protein